MLLLVVYSPKKKTLCCLLFNDGVHRNTSQYVESYRRSRRTCASPFRHARKSPNTRGAEDHRMQRAAAAVQTMTPLAFLARISAPIIQKTSSIISDALSIFMWCQTGTWLLESDRYREELKRKADDISRSQCEVYSFATEHNLSGAAVDELLGMLSNICT